MIATLVKTLSISSTEAEKLLKRLLHDNAIKTMSADKLNGSEDRRTRWTMFQNLDLWFDSWETFLVDFGFAHYNVNGGLVFKDGALSQILNMDKTCILFDKSNGNQGGRPTVTYYDKRFPHLGKGTSKTSLTTMMISGSNASGEPMIPHFQFQTSAKTDKAKAIRIECLRYMLDVKATLGHKEEQSFLVSVGMNHKGGIDKDEFLITYKIQ